MAIVHQMLDERILQLFQELPAHPNLYERLKEAEHQGEIYTSTIFHLKQDESIPLIRSFEEGIGFLAAEVGILLDGTYSYEAICDICDKIRERLLDRRAVSIHTPQSLDAEKPALILPKYMH